MIVSPLGFKLMHVIKIFKRHLILTAKTREKTSKTQYRELRRAQFSRLRFKHNRPKHRDSRFRQRSPNQNMARRHRIRLKSPIRKHPNGKRPQLHHRRPILLLNQSLS